MAQIFSAQGEVIPITVVEAGPCSIVQIKNKLKEGYNALQLGFLPKKERKVKKPLQGHFKKAGTASFSVLREFTVDDVEPYQLGQAFNVEIFEVGQKVRVTGVSKGKGFAGVIKRHNFSMQDATHGNSLSHRAPGSIGQNQTPGRVFKGKRMAGHMGNVKRTVQNLEVVRVDAERNLLLIKGAVPGAKDGDVIVRASVKARSGNTGS